VITIEQGGLACGILHTTSIFSVKALLPPLNKAIFPPKVHENLPFLDVEFASSHSLVWSLYIQNLLIHTYIDPIPHLHPKTPIGGLIEYI
jgi:hypothetical protein